MVSCSSSKIVRVIHHRQQVGRYVQNRGACQQCRRQRPGCAACVSRDAHGSAGSADKPLEARAPSHGIAGTQAVPGFARSRAALIGGSSSTQRQNCPGVVRLVKAASVSMSKTHDHSATPGMTLRIRRQSHQRHQNPQHEYLDERPRHVPVLADEIPCFGPVPGARSRGMSKYRRTAICKNGPTTVVMNTNAARPVVLGVKGLGGPDQRGVARHAVDLNLHQRIGIAQEKQHQCANGERDRRMNLPFSGRCSGARHRAHRVAPDAGAAAIRCAKSHDGQTIIDDIRCSRMDFRVSCLTAAKASRNSSSL